MTRPRASGCSGGYCAVELPYVDGDLENGTGVGRRLYRGC